MCVCVCLLQDLMESDSITLDWMFRYSLISDIIKVKGSVGHCNTHTHTALHVTHTLVVVSVLPPGDAISPQQRHCLSWQPEVVQLCGGQSLCPEDHRLWSAESEEQQLPRGHTHLLRRYNTHSVKGDHPRSGSSPKT